MQKSARDFNPPDRRVARRWRLASIGFYGSLIAGLAAYAIFSDRQGFDYAVLDTPPGVDARPAAR